MRREQKGKQFMLESFCPDKISKHILNTLNTLRQTRKYNGKMVITVLIGTRFIGIVQIYCLNKH